MPCGVLDGRGPRFRTLALVGNEMERVGCDEGTGACVGVASERGSRGGGPGASKPVIIMFSCLFFHLCNSFVVSFSTSVIVLFL